MIDVPDDSQQPVPAQLPSSPRISERSFPNYLNRNNTPSISNDLIIYTAIICLFILILLIVASMVFRRVMADPVEATVAEVPSETAIAATRFEFDEGYSIMLPLEFKELSRQETERGYAVYRFQDGEGCRFTAAIIPNEAYSRMTSPPRDYAKALIKSVPELSEGVDGDVQPTRVTVGSLPATIFRFYEKETYRGVNFTYHMVVMDRGKKLVLRFAGKYGGYSERSESITMPDHWYDSLLTLKEKR
ncbi:MAG: hypothetical protein P8L85_21535 [Rubripirellula sp.]|nr:hypothetical protein [Rubripirellula sp.]